MAADIYGIGLESTLLEKLYEDYITKIHNINNTNLILQYTGEKDNLIQMKQLDMKIGQLTFC